MITRTMTRRTEPNSEQLEAVLAYKEKYSYGRDWKQDLLDAWRTGRDVTSLGGHNGRGYLLRQVRNRFGPAWLAQFDG